MNFFVALDVTEKDNDKIISIGAILSRKIKENLIRRVKTYSDLQDLHFHWWCSIVIKYVFTLPFRTKISSTTVHYSYSYHKCCSRHDEHDVKKIQNSNWQSPDVFVYRYGS
jgi:hypothetical protein